VQEDEYDENIMNSCMKMEKLKKRPVETDPGMGKGE
jgi:hypothetical protein